MAHNNTKKSGVHKKKKKPASELKKKREWVEQNHGTVSQKIKSRCHRIVDRGNFCLQRIRMFVRKKPNPTQSVGLCHPINKERKWLVRYSLSSDEVGSYPPKGNKDHHALRPNVNALTFFSELLLTDWRKFPAKKWGDTEIAERGRSVLVMRAR